MTDSTENTAGIIHGGIFDTHAHYDDAAYDEDRDEVLRSLPGAGIAYVLDPGCTAESSRKAAAIAEKYKFVYAAAGIHPEYATGYKSSDLAEIEPLLAREKVVAIGEVGLDYYRDYSPRETQLECFRDQLALARELELPVIVHARDAIGDAMDCIAQFPTVRGVFHCYSGSVETARELVRRGWMISFTGVLTYKNARKSHEVLKLLPRGAWMIETDCPYMPPVPHRGERNLSSYLTETAKVAAEVRGEDVDDVIDYTRENGMRLFGIK